MFLTLFRKLIIYPNSSPLNSCNLLRQAPFSACHNHTDPEPFITACTETLCNYRLVDGVDCQFMEAYAQSCSLKADITLEDWRSTTTCCKIHFYNRPESDNRTKKK